MKSFVLTLAMLVLVLCWPRIAEACSCMPTHPQSQYCNSDFVILIRVKRERSFNQSHVYKVRVRKTYKLSEKSIVALKSGRLLTSSNSAMCGVDLEVGKLYAISGRVHSLKAYVSLCDLVVKWDDLTKRQRKGLKALYQHGCICKINTCLWSKCPKSVDACNWTSSCHRKEGICLRQKNKACMWTRNKNLANCLKSEKLTISR